MKFIVHTDGGARGNPGPAAVGVVIEEVISDKGKVISKTKITEFGKRIGETTNNVAEYTAVVEALKEVKRSFEAQDKQTEKGKSNENEIQFFLDSNLVVQQLNGLFKVKDTKLRELLLSVRTLEQEVKGAVTYQYVPREKNREADFLVNQALDS